MILPNPGKYNFCKYLDRKLSKKVQKSSKEACISKTHNR